MQTNVRLEHQLLAVEAEHRVHCMLELVAPPAPKGEPRKPFHLALVIDRSGSMAGRKLEVTRECASFLVQRLADTDELALITYDDEVSLLSPLMPVGRTRLGLAIGGIFPGGTTNLSPVFPRPLCRSGRLCTGQTRFVGVNAFPSFPIVLRRFAVFGGTGAGRIHDVAAPLLPRQHVPQRRNQLAGDDARPGTTRCPRQPSGTDSIPSPRAATSRKPRGACP